MKPTRRRLASVETAIAQLAEPAPPPPASMFEVIRLHTDGRVQLAAWTVPTEGQAETLAAALNERMEAGGGVTLATSGILERGWTYLARPAAS